jgi:hypothetical protein
VGEGPFPVLLGEQQPQVAPQVRLTGRVTGPVGHVQRPVHQPQGSRPIVVALDQGGLTQQCRREHRFEVTGGGQDPQGLLAGVGVRLEPAGRVPPR